MALSISNNSALNIGGLLVSRGVMTQDSIEQAKTINSTSGKSITNILIEVNSVSEDKIAEVIAENNGLPVIKLTQSDIDLDQVKLLPESFIKTNNVLPYASSKGYVSIAIVDPAAISLASNLKLLTKQQIDFTLTTFGNMSDAFGWAGFEEKKKKAAQQPVKKKKKQIKKK